ncbi:hypothetical protein AJ79_00151 [Helicocarpus griseus UAMH5409]|uniref:Uncharacterized protein n=1 Tax=Helicocarpus griseus UAMH5409 TaxID=1447875 RepID=A0A2B7YCV3_9EURO|nr:hypothetical protein AJ79_00151 [Helicocarpus griseus UAMH5409]
MSTSVLHHCTYCGHASEISNSLAAFAENPYCRQCGLSASESDSKMQDDLAALFARQMSVAGFSNPTTPKPQPQSQPASSPQTTTSATPEMSPPSTPSPDRPITYSITQHYHHSAHLHRLQNPSTGTWSLLSNDLRDMQRAGVSAEEMLWRNNVNPSALFPSQLTLFEQAGLEQKVRLIELWQISRPGAGDVQAFGGSASLPNLPTPVQSAMVDSQDVMDDCMGMDQDVTGSGNTNQVVEAGVDNQHAEPYVMSGYEALAQREYDASARNGCEHAFVEVSQTSVAAAAAADVVEQSVTPSYRPAIDPVYKGHGLWQQPMEHQYGAFEQRNMYIGCGVRRAHWLDDQEML